MKPKLLLITGLLFLFIGCDNYYMICSLNPFYIEKNILLESRIEGSWTAKPILAKKDSGSSSNSKIWDLADTTQILLVCNSLPRFFGEGFVVLSFQLIFKFLLQCLPFIWFLHNHPQS